MKYRLFNAAFVLACLLPLVGMLLLPPAAPAANEHPAPRPALRTEDGGWNPAVLDEVAAYVADHFAFRQQLVTANALLRTRLLASSPTADVVYGSDGWLYYGKTLDDYQHRATLTGQEARQAAQTVAAMQVFCEARGARFLFTIAPNKNSLYPEHMPARYLRGSGRGNYALLAPYLAEYGVHYADLFAFLSAQDETLYWKTDSHWTNRGAALAHDFLMDALGLPHTAFADASYTTEAAHRGDLYAMLYPAGTALEEQQSYSFAFSHVREPRSAEDIRIETTCGTARNGRLLFCRDSFGNALYPFLAEDFSETVVTRAMPYPLAEVQPGDTVIIEIVERNLPNLLKYPPETGNEAAAESVESVKE